PDGVSGIGRRVAGFARDEVHDAPCRGGGRHVADFGARGDAEQEYGGGRGQRLASADRDSHAHRLVALSDAASAGVICVIAYLRQRVTHMMKPVSVLASLLVCVGLCGGVAAIGDETPSPLASLIETERAFAKM